MAERGGCGKPYGRRWLLGSGILLWAGMLAGCGTPGAPQPPTLNLPAPVNDLAAQRTGDSIRLEWTMPTLTTDKVPLRGAIRSQICRSVGAGPCEPVGTQPFAPGKRIEFDDVLPTVLVTEARQLLTYRVTLQNRRGKSAGPSNPAYSASGPPVPALTGLRAEVRPDAVLLSWDPVPEARSDERVGIRIERRLEEPPSKPGEAANGARHSPTAGKQVLLVRPGAENGDAGGNRALDRDAAFGQSYRYRAQRFSDLGVGGQSVLIQGTQSEPVTIAVRDVFPPSAPAGLASAPDTEGRAIDLSWSPNSEPDLAGYFVYRRTPGETGTPLRISPGGAPVGTPSFRDSTAEPGRRYAYSVTAVDRNGNEGRPSAEVEDGLPQ